MQWPACDADACVARVDGKVRKVYRKGGEDGMDDVTMERLTKHAAKARARAYSPYSRFAVGAALLAEDGMIYEGCNVENASYGLTNCAERSAVFAMVTGGGKQIVGLAVMADAPRPISPCGACRQVLSEFASPQTPVWLSNVQGECKKTTMGELLPYAFWREDMNTHE